jgi:RNA polymerase sigma-70 factor (ECF subfamily)
LGIYSSISIEELAERCARSGEVAAWEEFVRRFHRLIAKVILRTAVRYGDSSKETVDDLIQETYLKFCADNHRILCNFDHRHPDAFTGFVQVVAANVARDHFRSSYSKRRGGNQLEGISEDFVPPAGENSPGSARVIERAVLIEEIRSNLDLCVAGSDYERSCRIFWLYYRAGLSASAIASLPGIGLTTKGVESLILRITKELKQRMTRSEPREFENKSASREGILPPESF